MSAWLGIGVLVAVVLVLLCWPLLRGGLSRGGMLVAGAIALLVAVALRLYMLEGRPGLASAPAATPPIASGDVRDRDQARAELLRNPANVMGWMQLAGAMSNMGETAQASEALGVALSAMPDSPDLWVAQGETLVNHAGGMITPAARLAFQRANRLVPGHPAVQYYAGLSWLQQGKPREALAAWEALARTSKPDAPWMPNVTRKIAAVQRMMAATAQPKP